jgi:hypothetical protein
MVDIADPSFDPHKLSLEDKIKLVQQSDGLLVDILAGCEIRDLYLRDCTSLIYLPDGLKIGGYLSLSGCTSLTHLPDDPKVEVGGNLYLRGCTSLTHLPDGLKVGGFLSLDGCTSLTHLPDGLEVGGNLYLDGCIGLQHYRDKEIKGVKGNTIWT